MSSFEGVWVEPSSPNCARSALEMTKSSRSCEARRYSPVDFVRKEGVEPSRPFGHTDLNRARLPFRHFRKWLTKCSRREAKGTLAQGLRAAPPALGDPGGGSLRRTGQTAQWHGSPKAFRLAMSG